MTGAGASDGNERFRVAVLPGDDAAPEAVYATLDVLAALNVPVDWDVHPAGEELAALGADSREQLVRDAVDRSATVLFGATSGKTGGIAYLRWGKGAYANVRPVRYRTGVPSPLREPEGIDYVIVRENVDDLYYGLSRATSTRSGAQGSTCDHSGGCSAICRRAPPPQRGTGGTR
jgi:isocitrate/isopropylmalate dehydrogenase